MVSAWWRQQDSNLPPDACKAPALPDELYPQYITYSQLVVLGTFLEQLLVALH